VVDGTLSKKWLAIDAAQISLLGFPPVLDSRWCYRVGKGWENYTRLGKATHARQAR